MAGCSTSFISFVFSTLLLFQCRHNSDSAVADADVRIPPKIIKGPFREKVYRADDTIILICLAQGSAIQYTWTKNGVVLEPRANIMYLADGIEISHLSLFDEGYYQCRASNMYGTSLSNISALQQATLGSYSSQDPVEYYNLEEGQPFVLKYSPVKCTPEPTFTWCIVNDAVDNSPQLMITSKRVQIDEDGKNLIFTLVGITKRNLS